MIHTRPSKHAPRRGPFAALAGVVRDRRPEPETYGWNDDRRLQKAFPMVPLPVDHPLKPYEGFEQNDAKVLGCAFGRDTFSLTLDHYNVWRLASVVQEDAWEATQGGFPVTLRFGGVREIWIVHQRGIGDYRILRASRRALPKTLNDLIALRPLAPGAGTLRFSLEIHRWGILHPELESGCSDEITILLECDAATVEENLREDWIGIVGPETLPLGLPPVK